jgi:putative flippase GtrA
MAFVLATGTSTVINFIGQKFWVFELKRKQVAKQLAQPAKQGIEN